MRKTLIITFLFSILLILLGVRTSSIKAEDKNLKLWYDQPATIWEEALPLGNGKIGAMVFGGIYTERYQLNDLTLWSGAPNAGNNVRGPEILKQTREAVNEGDYEKAGKIWRQIHGPYSARYLPMGDLFIKMNIKDSLVENYYRDLNIQNSIANVRYETNEGKFKRESFISFPDKIMVIQLFGNKKKSISFEAWLSSKLRYQIIPQSNNYIILRGKAPNHVAARTYEPVQIGYDDIDGEGTNFEIHLKIKTVGGTVTTTDNKIIVANADRVTLYISDATSYNGFDKSPSAQGKDPHVEASINIENAYKKTFEELKIAHLTDYQKLFNRVSFNLDIDKDVVHLPIEKRLMRLSEGKTDNQLQALYYQFGRYLLISSSRNQKMPANLQGLWNNELIPAWGCNYTTNINTEMNYWLAENTNLSECHAPLLSFLDDLAQNGAKTAKINYNLEGWCAHHNSDIWAKTSPAGGENWDSKSSVRWSCWVMAGAWLCQDLYRHYEYTGDLQFLREKALPLMKGAAQFLLGWLVEDKNGYLVTNPSTSPENIFLLNGEKLEISMASTMDMAITRDLFSNTIRTLEILDMEPEFRLKLQSALKRLYPYQIGRYGQLQEWFLDWDNPEDKHRHISQLFGLYPGTQISLHRTPELAAAAKQVLLHRGDVGPGWSEAWKVCCWARLEDGNHALVNLKEELRYITPRNDSIKGSGTYPNLLSAYPPFQIDGNFGATAGMTEMLLQSHDGLISLLPALPDAWKNGEITGIKARGGFRINIKWKNGVLSKAIVFSEFGDYCRIKTFVPMKVVEVSSIRSQGPNKNSFYQLSSKASVVQHNKQPLPDLSPQKEFIIDFETQKGKNYTLIPL
ncbi:MAG: glycoside hydrolase family 95 protein [Paludibacter sp.]|nr:glycoside hydrolase family 95 protein [Paludibacter sp.]